MQGDRLLQIQAALPESDENHEKGHFAGALWLDVGLYFAWH